MTAWSYSCELGFAQSTCGSYEQDPESRGHKAGWGGCPSCRHRKPANSETEQADLTYECRV